MTKEAPKTKVKKTPKQPNKVWRFTTMITGFGKVIKGTPVEPKALAALKELGGTEDTYCI